MIQFHDYPLSGNCFKVRFLLEQLGLEYQSILVDFYPGYEHKSPRFLNINPLGQLPAIMDKGQAVRDAQAILVYLAAAYDKSGKWFPRDHQGEVYQWLAFADQLTGSISAARLHDAMFYRLDVSKARTEGSLTSLKSLPRRVLVVDDEEAYLRCVQRLLKAWGFEAHCAKSGPAALAALEPCRPTWTRPASNKTGNGA